MYRLRRLRSASRGRVGGCAGDVPAGGDQLRGLSGHGGSRAEHLEPHAESTDVLGRDNAGSVLIQGQWWRIVTAMFVHVGIIHLATNMWCLWNLGLLAEPLMGSAGVLAVYILTGAAGNLLSTFSQLVGCLPGDGNWRKIPRAGAVDPTQGFSAGRWSIRRGLRHRRSADRAAQVAPVAGAAEELKKLRKSVIYFAALNLVLPFHQFSTLERTSGLRIDNMAHLGGFTCGLLFAAPMVPRIGSPRRLFLFRLRVPSSWWWESWCCLAFYLSKLRAEPMSGCPAAVDSLHVQE
jgi:rhomboid protease GluP